MNTESKIVAMAGAIIAFLVLVPLIMAVPTMLLWNWTVADITQTAEISFWQALGLNILCAILFQRGSRSRES